MTLRRPKTFQDSLSRFIGAIDKLVVGRFDVFTGLDVGNFDDRVVVKAKEFVLCQRG